MGQGLKRDIFLCLLHFFFATRQCLSHARETLIQLPLYAQVKNIEENKISKKLIKLNLYFF